MLAHHTEEIIRDCQIDDLKENGIDVALYDCPMSEIIQTDLFYTDNDEAWHILKFLQYLDTDRHIGYKWKREQRGFISLYK